MESSWIPVLSKKQKREVLLQKKKEEEQSRMYASYANIPLPEGPYVDQKGLPVAQQTVWPQVEKPCASPLLAEQIGSTDPKKIASSCDVKHPKVVKFIESFTLPIYHVSFEYEHDMGYDRKGRRAPVSYVNHMYIWTYHGTHPIIHMYDVYEGLGVTYKSSFSPFLFSSYDGDEYDDYNEWWSPDDAIRMREIL